MKKRSKKRSGLVVAMNARFGRKQVFRHRAKRRSKDSKNHWRREWE